MGSQWTAEWLPSPTGLPLYTSDRISKQLQESAEVRLTIIKSHIPEDILAFLCQVLCGSVLDKWWSILSFGVDQFLGCVVPIGLIEGDCGFD